MASCVLYKDNDSLVEVASLKDSDTEAFINDATVSCTVTDLDGNAVSGITWPLEMIYVPDSNGTYRAIIDRAIAVEYGGFYFVNVVAQAPGGLDATWKIKVQAISRTS